MYVRERIRLGWASGWPVQESQRKGKGPRTVSPGEYDFSDVPENELQSCAFYEFARESATVAREIESIRNQLANTEFKRGEPGRPINFKLIKVSKRSEAFEARFLAKLAESPLFPRVAWMDLSPFDRKWTIDLVEAGLEEHKENNLAFIAHTHVQANGLGELTLKDWTAKIMPPDYRKLTREQQNKWLLPGYFLINLACSSNQILDEMKRFILERHPKKIESAPEKRGRFSYRDWLNALGAMRLRFYCRTLAEAQGVTAALRRKERGLYYADRTSWNRACERAVDYFREVLDLPETDLPIHYTKGWQK